MTTTLPRPRRGWIGLLFVLPALGSNLLFDWYPTLEGVFRSFFRWDGRRLARWVGLDNFAEILSDRVFWDSVGNMAFFLFWAVALMVPTLVLSIVLFRVRNDKWQYLYRVLFCIPMVIPYVVVLMMWQFLYNPQFGFLDQALIALGAIPADQPILWLGDPNLVRWSLVLMGFPFIQTTAALIYLGGLQSIDEGIWEAAALDGVTPLQRFFRLEVPLVLGQFRLNLVGVVAGTITGFGNILIMTGGGPGFASLVPGLYMFNKAFQGHNEYGYASAVGLILFIVSLAVTLSTTNFLKREDQ